MAELPKIDSEGLRRAKSEGAKRVSSVTRVSRMTDMEKIATDCRAAAGYYEEHPAHMGPETISDIYRAIERLALAIQKHRIPTSTRTAKT